MRAAGFSVTVLGVAMLAATAGCTRTSDGSLEMRRPSLGRLFGSAREEEPAVTVPSRTLPSATSQPLPARLSADRPRSAVPNVSLPSLAIAKNPPFKPSPSGKPLSCVNSKTPDGRIKVVCA